MKKFFFKIILIAFICEFFFLIILISLKLINKISFKITEKNLLEISLYKSDFPHPILNKRSNKNEIRFDPNTVYYHHNYYRFGEKRKINKKKNQNDFNIFILGGSTVEGDGVDNLNDTIVSQIQKKIDSLKCENSVKTFNEGISGNSSKQDYLNLTLRIIPHNQPDLIISIQGWNDFMSYAGERDNLISPYAAFWTTREQAMYRYINSNKFLSKSFEFIINNSFTGLFVKSISINLDFEKKIQTSKRKIYLSKSEDLDILVKNYFYFQNLSNLVSKHNKIQYYHFLQPSLIYKKKPNQYEKNILLGLKNTKSYKGISNEIFSKQYWNNLKKFYDYILDDNRFQNNQWMIDFSNLYENSSEIDFVDHGHLSSKGQKKIAEAIFDKIQNEITCIRR